MHQCEGHERRCFGVPTGGYLAARAPNTHIIASWPAHTSPTRQGGTPSDDCLPERQGPIRVARERGGGVAASRQEQSRSSWYCGDDAVWRILSTLLAAETAETRFRHAAAEWELYAVEQGRYAKVHLVLHFGPLPSPGCPNWHYSMRGHITQASQSAPVLSPCSTRVTPRIKLSISSRLMSPSIGTHRRLRPGTGHQSGSTSVAGVPSTTLLNIEHRAAATEGTPTMSLLQRCDSAGRRAHEVRPIKSAGGSLPAAPGPRCGPSAPSGTPCPHPLS